MADPSAADGGDRGASVPGATEPMASSGPYCPACERPVAAWAAGPGGRPGARCPHCGALERHRFLAWLLNGLAPVLGSAEAVLDVAPQPQVRRILVDWAGDAYVGIDLLEPRVIDVRTDVTALPFPDDGFDFVLCYHVLEHLPDDRAAMRELARVLRPGGIALIQVPWRSWRETDEDPDAPEDERVERFGQRDHVRWYGVDFEERLRAEGLVPTRLDAPSMMDVAARRRCGVRDDEVLWVCRASHRPPRRFGTGRPTRLTDAMRPLPRTERRLLLGELDRLRRATVTLRRGIHDQERIVAALRSARAEPQPEPDTTWRDAYHRLRQRRSVDIALRLADATGPAFQIVRSARRALAVRADRADRAGEPAARVVAAPDAVAAGRERLEQSLTGPVPRVAVHGAGDLATRIEAEARRAGRLAARGAGGPSADLAVVADATVRPSALRDSCVIGLVQSSAGWDPDVLDDCDVVLAVASAADAIQTRGAVAWEALDTATPLLPQVQAAARRWAARRRWNLCVSTPSRVVADSWGDTFFARSLQKALVAEGCPTRVYFRDEQQAGHADTAHVSLHLAGLSVPSVRQGQVNVLWVISHPERATSELCAAYDSVLASSVPHADELQAELDVPVHVVEQATDPARFRPTDGGPAHDVLFVGNARWSRRHVIDDLTPTDLGLAIYGRGWSEEQVDPRHVAGDHVPNDELAAHYGAAAIVLNDQWPEMAAKGMISNRLYDALASGAFVISDDAVGIDSQFDGAVVVYRERDELHALIEEFLADAEARRERAERGRAAVLARHTFAHRAAELLRIVDGVPNHPPASRAGR